MLLTFLTTKLLPPTSHHQPHPLHCPCPLSVPIPTQLWGFSEISCNVFTVPQARSSPLHKDPTPAMSHLSASWEYLGLGTSSPSSLQQQRKVRNRWRHCHGSGDTFISCLSPVLLLPSLGTVCQLLYHELSQQALWEPAEPVSVLAGDAAHRAAGARVLRFALGHALRMLPEPAASSRDERSQPVPSCRTRPACPAAGSLPSCQLPAGPPGPCSASGWRGGSKSGRKILAFGRSALRPPRCPVCVRFAL